MSRCAEILDLVGPWADGELDPARSAEMEEHLRSCDSCSRVVEALGRLDAAAAAAFTPPPVGGARWEEVWRGVSARTLEARHRSASRRWLWPAAAAAVVLVGAAALSLWLRPVRPVAVFADLRPGVVEYVESPSAGYITTVSVGEGEVPVVYVTEVR